ncbi:PH domain-containing protein, partial [Thauera aromatica]
ATALSLNACPYLATSFFRYRPRISDSIETTTILTQREIESIQVNQGILGRIFNFGSIVVSGAGNPQAPIPGISGPLNFRRAFIDTQESNGQPQAAAQPA